MLNWSVRNRTVLSYNRKMCLQIIFDIYVKKGLGIK